MEQTVPPTALVLGCNTPHGVGVLSDWIEEQTGHAPDFHGGSWDCLSYMGAYGGGLGYGTDNGDGYGDGLHYGSYDGGGFGFGDGFWSENPAYYRAAYGDEHGNGGIDSLNMEFPWQSHS